MVFFFLGFFFLVGVFELARMRSRVNTSFLMLLLADLLILLEHDFRWHSQGITLSKGEIGKELLPLAAMGSE